MEIVLYLVGLASCRSTRLPPLVALSFSLQPALFTLFLSIRLFVGGELHLLLEPTHNGIKGEKSKEKGEKSINVNKNV